METRVDISEKQEQRMVWLYENEGLSFLDLSRMYRIGAKRVGKILKARGAVRLLVKSNKVAQGAAPGDVPGDRSGPG